MSQNLLETNCEIDFLPAGFREESAQRKISVWRLSALALFMGLILSAALFQYRARLALQSEIDALTPLHEEAQRRTTQLDLLHAELKEFRARAELVTYLRSPWPRTQILAAVLKPLPPAITLRELRLGLIADTSRAPAPRTEKDHQSAENTQEKQPVSAAQQDLQQLREEFGSKHLTVSLSGTTPEVSELHAYLEKVIHSGFIAKTELRSIERAGNTAGGSSFEARLIVVPAYGTPGHAQRQSPDKREAEEGHGA